MANSLVGDRINALAPHDAFRLFSFSNSGMRKQAVLPEPVFAIATTSRPSRISGIVYWNGWTDVSCVQQMCVWWTNLSLNRCWNFVSSSCNALHYIKTQTHCLKTTAVFLASRFFGKSSMVDIVIVMIDWIAKPLQFVLIIWFSLYIVAKKWRNLRLNSRISQFQ